MSEITLTKDADALICVLYKEYLHRRNSGVSKADAKMFFNSEKIHDELMPKWPVEDIDDTCWELNRAGLLDCMPGEDSVALAVLSSDGVAYMEKRFQKNITSIVNYLGKVAAHFL